MKIHIWRTVAVDFGGSGVWNWDGSAWNLIIDYDTNGLTSWKNGLAVNPSISLINMFPKNDRY